MNKKEELDHFKSVKYKETDCPTFDFLIDQFPDKEFKSPYRSTIPLLVLFCNRTNELNAFNDYNKYVAPEFIFEHETPVKKGKGKPSCSDLVIETEEKAVVIEAKRTELRYIKVKDWLDNTQNKNDVLDGWIESINNQSDCDIKPKDIQEIPYQMIHRIASACSLKKKDITVVYMGFDLDKKKEEYYKSNLLVMSLLLKHRLNIFIADYKIHPSETQINLQEKWDSGVRDLSAEVRLGLINNELMEICENKVEKIICGIGGAGFFSD